MRKLATLTAVAALAAGFAFAGTAMAAPDDLYPRHANLEADGDWLIAHFDDRDGVFNDGADVSFIGKLPNHKHTDFEIGEFTVEASAAWDWTKWTPEHPAAPVYAGFSVYTLSDNDPISMPPRTSTQNAKLASRRETSMSSTPR